MPDLLARWGQKERGARMKKTYHGLIATLVVAVATPAGAHHSPGMFDQQHQKSITGTVSKFQWTNPHCYIQLVVKNAKGVDEEWSLEMGAPMYLYNQGWRPSTVKAGDKITVTIAPLRKGGTAGLVLAASSADGKPLGTKP